MLSTCLFLDNIFPLLYTKNKRLYSGAMMNYSLSGSFSNSCFSIPILVLTKVVTLFPRFHYWQNIQRWHLKLSNYMKTNGKLRPLPVHNPVFLTLPSFNSILAAHKVAPWLLWRFSLCVGVVRKNAVPVTPTDHTPPWTRTIYNVTIDTINKPRGPVYILHNIRSVAR